MFGRPTPEERASWIGCQPKVRCKSCGKKHPRGTKICPIYGRFHNKYTGEFVKFSYQRYYTKTQMDRLHGRGKFSAEEDDGLFGKPTKAEEGFWKKCQRLTDKPKKRGRKRIK